MTGTRKDRIAAAFGAAAQQYDAHADVQRVAARTVADLAALLPVPDDARILEIGCGTGLLTREIASRWPGTDLVATDLSARMVAHAAQGGMAAGRFLAMDGEQPWFEGPHFDLILSSLAFQWFDDLPLAIARLVALLRPGGRMIFSTMGANSFAGWCGAHAACGVTAGVPAYPTLTDLKALLAPYGDAFAFDEDYPVAWGSAKALVAHLKGIGAIVPMPDRAPLPPRALRQVMTAFDGQGGTDSYHVLFGRVTRG